MNVVSLIPSYNPHNEFVGTVVDELKKFSKVVLFTTEPHTLNVDETVYFDKSVGRELVYKPKEWISNNLDKDWDFALYNEDDIFNLIEEKKSLSPRVYKAQKKTDIDSLHKKLERMDTNYTELEDMFNSEMRSKEMDIEQLDP